MTPILLEAARMLREWDPELTFLLPAASPKVYDKLQPLVGDKALLYNGKAQEMLSISELAIMTSGSVSLEAAYLDCPMVLGYRFNRFDAALGRFLIRTGILKLKHFALPNLVLDETILPELLQEWSEQREESWNKAVMIVFPTQYGCQNIKNSLITFRGKRADELTLRTGGDTQDRFWEN